MSGFWSVFIFIVVAYSGASGQGYYNPYAYPQYNFSYTQPQRFPPVIPDYLPYQAGLFSSPYTQQNLQPPGDLPQADLAPYHQQQQPGGAAVSSYNPYKTYYPYKSPTPYKPGKDCFTKGKVVSCSSVPNDEKSEKIEIIDVSPEYHRRLFGLPPKSVQPIQPVYSPQQNFIQQQTTRYGAPRQGFYPRRRRYKVEIQTTNNTHVPSTITFKPIIRSKTFNSTLRRTIVYDPSKPVQAINLTFVNGELVSEQQAVIKPVSLDEEDDEDNDEEEEEEEEETTTTTTEATTTTENVDAPPAVDRWF